MKPLARSFTTAFLWILFCSSLSTLTWAYMERSQEHQASERAQVALNQQWDQATQSQPSQQAKTTPPLLQGHEHKKLAPKTAAKKTEPWPLTRLLCPRLGLDVVVVQGIGDDALRRGPGHDPQSSNPGLGHCIIAAHRNMAGSWFYRLDELTTGDEITLKTPRETFRYTVSSTNTVHTKETAYLRHREETPLLTLYTCTLPKSENRLVVTASLTLEKPGSVLPYSAD